MRTAELIDLDDDADDLPRLSCSIEVARAEIAHPYVRAVGARGTILEIDDRLAVRRANRIDDPFAIRLLDVLEPEVSIVDEPMLRDTEARCTSSDPPSPYPVSRGYRR